MILVIPVVLIAFLFSCMGCISIAFTVITEHMGQVARAKNKEWVPVCQKTTSPDECKACCENNGFYGGFGYDWTPIADDATCRCHSKKAQVK